MSKPRGPIYRKDFGPTIPSKVRCNYCLQELQDKPQTRNKHWETCKKKPSENNKSKNVEQVVRKYHANKLF